MQETLLQSIVIVTLVFLFFLVVFGLFIYRHFKKEKENERALFSAVIKAQEEERQIISSNIHDDLGALLTSGRISINNLLTHPEEYNLEELKHLANVIDDASKSAKTASNALTPHSVSKYGLKGAIADLPIVYKKAEVAIDINYNIQKELDTFIEISIFRIINEIVNNSVKYAQAKNIYVYLKDIEKNKIKIEVGDNGIGFNLNAISDESNGVRNIRSRVSMMNGELWIETSEGKGCKYIITI